MRTLAVIAVFLSSLLGLGATLKARAETHIAIIPAPFDSPSLMDEGAGPGGIAGNDDSKKKQKPKKDGGTDDEEKEEDLVPGDAQQNLESLDPALLQRALRFKFAVK